MLKSFLFFFRHIRCNFYIFEHRRIFYFKIRRLWTESCLTITLRLCYCNTLISPLNQIAFTTTREQLYQSVFVISCIVAQLTHVCVYASTSIQTIKTCSIAHQRQVRVHHIHINAIVFSLLHQVKDILRHINFQVFSFVSRKNNNTQIKPKHSHCCLIELEEIIQKVVGLSMSVLIRF